MSGPITWKNVNQPNFGASNTLALAASKQLSNAFDSGSQRLIDQGQYNEEQNNDAFAAKLAQYSDYDDLSGAKGNLFQDLEGQNIDTVAALDSYNSSIDRLGQKETFDIGRKDRADTEAGNTFARQLMNNGMTNQREVQSAVMAEGLKQGWSDTSTGNVITAVNRDFQPTIEEAANTTATLSALDYQREVNLQAQEDKAATLRASIKAGTQASADLEEGLQSKNWKVWLENDEDAKSRYRNNRKLYKTAGVPTKVFDQVVKKYYDKANQTIRFGALEKEMDSLVAAAKTSKEWNALDPVTQEMKVQSYAIQNNISIEKARNLFESAYNTK